MKCYNCLKEIEQADICPYCNTNQTYEKIEFNVKGITFENEEGKDIQKEIRKIFLEYVRNDCFEKYGGYTNEEIKEFVSEIAEFEDAEVEIKLKEDIYEEKNCIKIYIKKYDGNYCHIGFMPKELVKKYLKLKKNFKEVIIEANLVGGKIKQLEYDYEIDKEKVVIIDLDYGFEVSLVFYNEIEKYQKQIEKKKKETLARYEKMLKEEKEEQEHKETIKEIEKNNKKNNTIIFIITVIISIPFIWMFWKVLSFIFWLLE